ncbi:hypothetical protein R5R35_002260 [Gryllus longicercus]|uniref:F-box domain-containing protein n=1 Tax=Gryllus longicercus TaxID=2509291 RepID=A0AAN9VMJ5_9ORTH
MKQGLRKVDVTYPKDLVVMNEIREEGSGNRKIKRQKLSNDHCETRLDTQIKQSVPKEHCMERGVMDSVESEKSKVENLQQNATSIGSVAVKKIPTDDDCFLIRRKLHHTGEDLSRKLSDELMLIIFRWLPKRSLVRCAFVCKRWRQIAYDESLWTRLDLGSGVLKSGSLSYVLARGVSALRLAQADIHEPIFSSPCSIVENGAFNKLQYLDLSMTVISGKDLAELLKTCQSLLKLSLERCSIIQESCCAISINSKLEVLNMSMCCGLKEIGLRKILSGCQKLTELNLAWTCLNSSALEILARFAPRTLGRLNISGCGKYLSDKHICQLVQTCPHLVELDLSDCTSLTASCIEYICNLQKLEHVALSRCYNIGSSSYLLLSRIDSLLYLDVMGLFADQSLVHLKQNLSNISVNKFLFSSIARPTVGVRRTSIWGLKVRR